MLNIREKSARGFDEISLGEVMLRLDPGDGRVRTARNFAVWEGGGEYNVARGLRKCFRLNVSVVTAFAENEVGALLEDLISQGGVDTSYIKWVPYDGIGRSARNGLNFTERGYGVRGALGVSDRANTAASQIKCGDFDWDKIFTETGARWFHTGGIFAALSASTAKVAVEALKSAKKHGVITSYDLNYRPSLWKDIGGQEKAREVNREIVGYTDVCIGNEEDFTACLGFEAEGSDKSLKELNIEGYKKMVGAVAKEYGNIKVVASTLRTVRTATVNDWSAVCFAGGNVYKAPDYKNLEIFDRVGGGDSFASGLIYGFLTGGDPQKAVNYGCAHGALAMTTPGDTSMASLREVEKLISGAGARVDR
ncbi:MAG: sugar kinase [Oscillospiraceae bacterium]|jgi:2-dehydro-3-deoxygluconokinase|nr:sugar kinase [Oscillospiraceae bacterium]